MSQGLTRIGLLEGGLHVGQNASLLLVALALLGLAALLLVEGRHLRVADVHAVQARQHLHSVGTTCYDMGAGTGKVVAGLGVSSELPAGTVASLNVSCSWNLGRGGQNTDTAAHKCMAVGL